jgi:hypothetical protein
MFLQRRRIAGHVAVAGEQIEMQKPKPSLEMVIEQDEKMKELERRLEHNREVLADYADMQSLGIKPPSSKAIEFSTKCCEYEKMVRLGELMQKCGA